MQERLARLADDADSEQPLYSDRELLSLAQDIFRAADIDDSGASHTLRWIQIANAHIATLWNATVTAQCCCGMDVLRRSSRDLGASVHHP